MINIYQTYQYDKKQERHGLCFASLKKRHNREARSQNQLLKLNKPNACLLLGSTHKPEKVSPAHANVGCGAQTTGGVRTAPPRLAPPVNEAAHG